MKNVLPCLSLRGIVCSGTVTAAHLDHVPYRLVSYRHLARTPPPSARPIRCHPTMHAPATPIAL
eukprot:CAMPEP_0181206184 /NCGR_PEP_ID=MMETSP1096-20121128/20898_1 /TAXON_ID=156174 ORGANISM="Chrysochromulina ericina, Strain CCMP281" /NCGR_SAMPLE_ID=MMETSP1096 /ASSEMBLY_ACC=CAM_ASM_000453 /LENGTH=63 /DNA_ID=CAMNT_0023297063 /DNA_START=222 /DNA_END=413 /DNA_ORIENTATION=-